jgi:hypothetical protein
MNVLVVTGGRKFTDRTFIYSKLPLSKTGEYLSNPYGIFEMTDQWRWVVGFPDYQVSDLGRVYSHVSKKYLRPGVASHGYPTVALGRGNTRTVHSLVAEAFIGPCPVGQEVRHGDDNRKNPRLDNLEYGTRKQNVADMFRRGRYSVGDRKITAQKAKETRLKNGGYEEGAAKTQATRLSNNPNTYIDGAAKTVETKNETYGKSWGALGFAGVEYSKS